MIMLSDLVVVTYEFDVQRRNFMSRMSYAAEYLAHSSQEITNQDMHKESVSQWRNMLGYMPYIEMRDPDTGRAGYYRMRNFLDGRLNEAKY